MNRRVLLTTTAAAIAGLAMWRFWPAGAVEAKTFEITRSDAEWRKLLTQAKYDVLRNHGTERPFTSPLDAEKPKTLEWTRKLTLQPGERTTFQATLGPSRAVSPSP